MNRLELEKKRDELKKCFGIADGPVAVIGWDRCANLLMPENEQLRAQLAERDKEIERLEGEQIVGGIARHYQLMRELSQAQETIADFRAALKGILSNVALDWYIQQFGKNENPSGSSSGISAYIHNRETTERIKQAFQNGRETLSKHADSTEVKGTQDPENIIMETSIQKVLKGKYE